MTINEEHYINKLRQSIYDRIDLDINNKSLDDILKFHLVESHLNNKASSKFQKYYFSIVNNPKIFLGTKDFFKKFKSSYSLQGIDNLFLDRLEQNKKEILEDIQKDRLVKVYIEKFKDAEIKYGQNVKRKSLGSFFAKLVHTFKPDKYCALDNPIKNYFGLKNESFFISFFTISYAYKKWSADNEEIIEVLKKRFKKADSENIIRSELCTDLKLLDLIFWSKAKTQM